MKSAERLLKLKQVFATREFVDVEGLALLLGASDSTIRRDLINLEREGVLRRVHGGALSIQARDEALDYGKLAASSPEAKERIGKACAELLIDEQTIFMGTGTTVVEVAKHLLARPFHVITNSIPVAEVFWDSKTAEITLTGGYLYPRTGAQLGPICEQMVGSVNADVAVLGIGGVSEAGLSDSNTLIMGTMRKMIDRARRVILVVDHTKFGRDKMVRIARLDEIDVIVSDRELGAEHRKMIEKEDIELVLA